MSDFRDIEKKFRDTVKRWGLIRAGDKILVGLSGGVDSMTLLHLLCRLPDSLHPKIEAVHYHHGLRGSASDHDEALVRRVCKQASIPLHVGRSRPWKSRENLEARARHQRYEFFWKVVRRRRIPTLVTAHHADDQAETFLLRWLQGAGLKGLAGISLERKEGVKRLIRPLLFMSRGEILRYADHFHVLYREDASNHSSAHLRNRLRKIMIFFRRENPRIAERTAGNAVFLNADQRFLEKCLQDVWPKRAGEDVFRVRQGIKCRVSFYSRLDPSLRYRFLQDLARRLLSDTYALPSEAVLKLDELLLSKEPRLHYDLPHGLIFSKETPWSWIKIR